MEEQKSILADSDPASWYDHNGEPKSNDYPQLGNRYRALSEDAKSDLINNIISLIKKIDGPAKEMTVNVQLCHWFRTDMDLGMSVANGLNINLQDLMRNMPQN